MSDAPAFGEDQGLGLGVATVVAFSVGEPGESRASERGANGDLVLATLSK
jgi:hypothetical protein